MSDEPRVPSLEHVGALTDEVGIFQHATYDVPNRTEGYCTDDVARAFVVVNLASAFSERHAEARRLGTVYLAFLQHAQTSDGRFHNFMNYGREWLDDAGSADSNGRALWAAGHGMRFAPRESWRSLCRTMFERALPHASVAPFARSLAYAALGLAHAYDARMDRIAGIEHALRAIGNDLAARHAATATAEWDWFEDELTYDNARLPEAVMRIAAVLGDETLRELGLRTFAFYERVTVEGGVFVPIGNRGWYRRGAARARYAQQPLEAAAFVDAALAAEALTGERQYRRLAEIGFAWFRGGNSRGLDMIVSGGCCDGLEADALNRNMGAESTLAYVASAFAMSMPARADVFSLAR